MLAMKNFNFLNGYLLPLIDQPITVYQRENKMKVCKTKQYMVKENPST